jgi:hypothetical protein
MRSSALSWIKEPGSAAQVPVPVLDIQVLARDEKKVLAPIYHWRSGEMGCSVLHPASQMRRDREPHHPIVFDNEPRRVNSRAVFQFSGNAWQNGETAEQTQLDNRRNFNGPGPFP